MPITCHAQQTMPCAPPVVFALMVDPLRFASTFTGYGPIPGIRAVTLDAPLAVGSTRRIHNTDGSILTGTVTVLDAPTRHAYTLGGFRAPFSWLVAQGEAEWSVGATASGSRVRWDYTFSLVRAWTYPLAAVLLRFCMSRAMQRCLDTMARRLAAPAARPAATA